MAKISHGAHSWRSEGLAKKYKEQEKIAFDTPQKHKTKKNTRKWCKGKVGVNHTLERYFWRYGWESKKTNWIRTRCVKCLKEFHANNKDVPLKIELDEDNINVSYPVQVKVNGSAIPFTYCQLKSMQYDRWYYCEYCKDWH